MLDWLTISPFKPVKYCENETSTTQKQRSILLRTRDNNMTLLLFILIHCSVTYKFQQRKVIIQNNCISKLLYCTVLYCTVLYCTALHCTALHCTALHCTALHCTALHCTALHCTGICSQYHLGQILVSVANTT